MELLLLRHRQLHLQQLFHVDVHMYLNMFRHVPMHVHAHMKFFTLGFGLDSRLSSIIMGDQPKNWQGSLGEACLDTVWCRGVWLLEN